MRIPSLVRQLLVAMGAMAAIIFTVARIRPVFVGRAPVMQTILTHHYVDSATIHAPWIESTTAVALGSPQFLADRERFMRDLLRTGRVNQARAWQLADVAVREAYRRRLPPALVLGVMLTENDALDSRAHSNAGAVGLMQVHGSAWRETLGRHFGTNLQDDSTNVRYGVFILGYLANRAATQQAARGTAPTVDTLATPADSSWRLALLRYNGCVRGSNTRNCRAYPATVRRKVAQFARSTCNGRDFDECVARPLWLGSRARARGRIVSEVAPTGIEVDSLGTR